MKQMLLDKIKNKQIEVGVVGLGYVGMPIAVAFARKVPVIGFDLPKPVSRPSVLTCRLKRSNWSTRATTISGTWWTPT